MADTCFVCHMVIPGARNSQLAAAESALRQYTSHSKRSIYALLEQFVGHSLAVERHADSRWCARCVAVINEYDLAYSTAQQHEKELVQLYMAGVKSEEAVMTQTEERLVEDEEEDEEEEEEEEEEDDDDEQVKLEEVVEEGQLVELVHETGARIFEYETDAPENTDAVDAPVQSMNSATEEQHIADEHFLDDEAGQLSVTGEVYLSDDVEEELNYDELASQRVDQPHIDESAELDNMLEFNDEGTSDQPPATSSFPGDHTVSMFTCVRCETYFETNAAYKVHIRACKTVRKQFDCEICGHTCRSRTALQIHVGKHNGTNPVECDVCGKQFMNRGTLVRHMPMHTGEKPYQCDKCGKQFIHYSSFHMHQLAHQNVRDKQCTVCGMELRSNSHLTRHMRVHSGEKPYACPTCNQRFAQRYNMMTHYKTHMGIHRASAGRTHTCATCGEQFIRSSLLKHHQANKHGGLAPVKAQPQTPLPPRTTKPTAMERWRTELEHELSKPTIEVVLTPSGGEGDGEGDMTMEMGDMDGTIEYVLGD